MDESVIVWPFAGVKAVQSKVLILYISLDKVVLPFASVDEILTGDHSNESYPAVLFVILCKVVQTFASVDEIQTCDHSNES